MKLLFKQRLFSWLSAYDIFDEDGNAVFAVKGELAWGHKLRVYDVNGNELGLLRQKMMTFLPKFDVYIGNDYVGCIRKEFAFLKQKFNIDYMGWQVDGNIMGWNYSIVDAFGREIATVSKQLWKLTDTYVMDIYSPENALSVLMLVLAIDAEKASNASVQISVS